MKDLLRCVLALLVATLLSTGNGKCVSESDSSEVSGTLVSKSSDSLKENPKEMGKLYEKDIAFRIKKPQPAENSKELGNSYEEDIAFRIKKPQPAENSKELGNSYEEDIAFRIKKPQPAENSKELGNSYEEDIAFRIKKPQPAENSKELGNSYEEDIAFRIKKPQPAENSKELGNSNEENIAFRIKKDKSDSSEESGTLVSESSKSLEENPEEMRKFYEEDIAFRKAKLPTDCPKKKASKNSKKSDNPEENGKFEGDILLPKQRSGKVRHVSAVMNKKLLWPKGVIPYEIKGTFSASQKAMINTAMGNFKKHTCLRWVPRKKQTSWVIITSKKDGCHSSVGMQGGGQTLNLSPTGCFSKIGTVMHEMMHAAGFGHEQVRSDRDKYITIVCNNIDGGKEHNFNSKLDTYTHLGFPYDYGSLMHYPSTAFSTSKKKTIIPKNPKAKIGQRLQLSAGDIKKIKKLYNCK